MVNRYPVSRIASILLFLILIIFGFLAFNPTVLQNIIGENLYLRYGLFIIALLTVFFKFYVPRLKPIIESGDALKFDMGSISTFAATALGLFASVAILYPDTVTAFLGQMGLASYSTTIIYLLTAVADLKFPRNALTDDTTVDSGAGQGEILQE